MNKARDYRVLEREYITSQMSLRELCHRHGITAHSLVVVQAQKGRWQEKRDAYRARESESFITKHADRMAAREAEVRIHALDATDEAIDKFRSDMGRTERTLVNGEWVEVPVMLITPKDVVLLIDKIPGPLPSPLRHPRGAQPVGHRGGPRRDTSRVHRGDPRADSASPSGVTDPATATPPGRLNDKVKRLKMFARPGR